MAIWCAKCGGKTTVYNSRERGDTIKRHRKCPDCGNKLVTLEIPYDEYIYLRRVAPTNKEKPHGSNG